MHAYAHRCRCTHTCPHEFAPQPACGVSHSHILRVYQAPQDHRRRSQADVVRPRRDRPVINVVRLFAFSGRPMIECSECLTWIHLSCAKIRKSNVPDVFICQKCRDAKHTMRRSNRVRTQPKTKAINFKP